MECLTALDAFDHGGSFAVPATEGQPSTLSLPSTVEGGRGTSSGLTAVGGAGDAVCGRVPDQVYAGAGVCSHPWAIGGTQGGVRAVQSGAQVPTV